MSRHICSKHFKNAIDFVEAISPRGRFFGPSKNPSPWIFRGQALDEWPLIPSALRSDKQVEVHDLGQTSLEVRQQLGTNLAQAIAELSILYHLEQELDRQGLEVPSSPMEIAKHLESLKHSFAKSGGDDKPTDWPRIEFAEIMSLAQHYQLPTRLLDWSRSAFIAAYFAADPKRIREKEDAGNASLWALDTAGWADGLTTRKAPNLRVIAVRRKINPHLHAQDGVFTLITADGLISPRRDKVVPIPLDEAIAGFNESHVLKKGHLFFYHFTFPRCEARRVLWLLEKEGVTASKLFPGQIGAARAIMDRALALQPNMRRTLPLVRSRPSRRGIRQ